MGTGTFLSLASSALATALLGCVPAGVQTQEPAEPAPVAADAVSAEEPPPETRSPGTVAGQGASVVCPDAVEPGASNWTCSMHPQVREQQPGTCPICAMDLVEQESSEVLSENAPPDVEAVPPYAHLEPGGLATCVVRPGRGDTRPSPQDRVTVHYAGWTADGQCFDSSVRRGQPATFPLNGVIEGWTRGVPLMVEGEVRRFWIPGALAYGDEPTPGRPTGMLVFDVELISIEPD